MQIIKAEKFVSSKLRIMLLFTLSMVGLIIKCISAEYVILSAKILILL